MEKEMQEVEDYTAWNNVEELCLLSKPSLAIDGAQALPSVKRYLCQQKVAQIRWL